MEVAEHDVGRLLAGRLSDAFFRRAPDALVLLDRGVRPHGAPHLTIVAANAAAGVLAGRPPDELVGRPGRDVVPAALRHGFENVCTEASRSGRAAQARLVGPGAASEWFDVLAVPDADGLAVAIRSPTGERVAADRLELGDRRLESILEALGLVVYEAEILPDGSWTTLFRGPGADRLLGLPLGDEGPSAEAWLQRVHGDDRDLYRAYLERMRAGEDASVEYRVVADDGRERRLHSRCHVRSRRGGGVLVGGMVSDVSEAQRAHIEMVEARTALARVVAGIEEVLYTIELPDGGSPRVSYLSSGWERLVGRPITAEEATGALLTLVHPDDLPVVEAGNARLARGEQVEMVYRLRRPDGGERHLLDRARPRADTKDPVVADGIVIDVTDRLRSEAALRDSEARLVRVTRAAPVALFEVDARGVLIAAEGRALEDIAIRPDEHVGRSLDEVYGAGSDVARALRHALEGESVAATLDHGDAVFDVRLEPAPDASGAVIGVALDVTARVRAERALAELAAEQGALRRVATAVANHVPPAEVFALVAEETARLLGADGALVCRLLEDGRAEVRGAATSRGVPPLPNGTIIPPVPGGLVEQIGRGARHVRVPTLPAEVGAAVPALAAYRSAVGAPVTVGDRRWGALFVGSTTSDALVEDAGGRLARFAELVGAAIESAETHARLATEALTDPLTGLLNHRGFHDRTAQALARVRRRDGELSLILMDVDHFKQINDAGGHQVGDRVLHALAERLGAAVRAGESLGRLGGDEFAVLLPDVGPVEAVEAAERLRERIAAEPVAGHRVTVSIGVCDLARAGDDVDALYRLADGALYWAKGHGRDATWLYSPDVVRELSAGERANRLARSHALAGIRALARAIDAKDATTAHHSERVADVAAGIATALGWPEESVGRLRDAARVHDVGKIGVPDSVLLKPGPLTPDEFRRMQLHAELGAQIAEEVLDDDQVAWIRAHHERQDGSGYPSALAGGAIPEGAAILALADAWDVMTSDRPYRTGMDPRDAVAECRRCAGTQFAEEVVQAFLRL